MLKVSYRSLPWLITLSEVDGKPGVPREVQLLRTGTFSDPRYGKFTITKDMLLSMKTNFDAKIHGVDPAIDYAHESDKVAAGWPKSLILKEAGTQLWAEVDWTPKGEQVLADKEFRYLSADFRPNYVDNEKNKSYGPTLLGAGLTNRPVIKGMAPALELSEFTGKESEMTLEQALAKIAELEAQLKAAGCSGAEMSDMKKQLADSQKQLADFQAKEKVAVEEKKLAEKKAKFDVLLSEGKVVEAQREPFMAGDAMKMAELASNVNLNPAGHGGQGSGSGGSAAAEDAQDQVMKLAEKKIADKHAIDLGQAMSMVLSENAELRKKYEAETK